MMKRNDDFIIRPDRSLQQKHHPEPGCLTC